VSEEVNKRFPPGSTKHEVQFSTPYTDSERHNAQRHSHRRRDELTDGQTDDSIMPTADQYHRLIKAQSKWTE